MTREELLDNYNEATKDYVEEVKTSNELRERIAELEAKVWDAHLRENTLKSKLRNKEEEFSTLLAYSRKQERDLKDEKESKAGVENLLSEALEQGRKMQEERDELQNIVLDKDNEVKKLQYQVEQRDKTIVKAHNLLVTNKKLN